MEKTQTPMTRRHGLVWGTHVLLGAAFMGMTDAAKAVKADKKDFYYQDKPNSGKQCSNCSMYSVGPGGKSVCAIVDGEISPHGWCMAYSPRA